MSTWTAFLASLPLLILIITWAAMSNLLQNVQVNWPRPWLLTYTIHSGYALSLVPYALLWRAREARRGPSPAPPWPRVLLATFGLATLASVVGVTYYASLNGTSVAGNSAVYQCSSAFALLFSAVLLRERVTLAKLLAVALAVAGVALVALGARGGGGDSPETPAGYAWVITSTALYALYEVLFARAFPSRADAPAAEYAPLAADGTDGVAREDEAGKAPSGSLAGAEVSALVLGSMGVWTLLTQWPFFFIADAAGLEPLGGIPSEKLGQIALTVFFDCVYNLALLWGVATSTPFAMSLATTLVVPVTVVTDFLLHKTLPTPTGACGIVLILAAVAALNTPPAAYARCFSQFGRAR